jgi:hypothetical protein
MIAPNGARTEDAEPDALAANKRRYTQSSEDDISLTWRGAHFDLSRSEPRLRSGLRG